MGFPWLLLLTFAFGSSRVMKGVLDVWLGTAGASGKCLQCFRVVFPAVVKYETSMKNRSWSELEGLWVTIVMGWQVEAREGEGKGKDAAMRRVSGRAGRVVVVRVCVYLCSSDYFQIACERVKRQLLLIIALQTRLLLITDS